MFVKSAVKLMSYCRHDDQFLIIICISLGLFPLSISLGFFFFLQSSFFGSHLFKFNVKERVPYQLFRFNSRIIDN